MTYSHNLDLRFLWNPCSQLKDQENFPPAFVSHSRGPYIYTTDQKSLIDATSSWWCKTLGHNHPRLKEALKKQLDQFEHVSIANTTYELLERLSEKLCFFQSNLKKAYYASDGASAVEIAMKMSLHSRIIQKQPQKQKFITLKNSYHGETMGALSVTDLPIYTQPFQKHLSESIVISNIPYLTDLNSSLWKDASHYWKKIEPYLNQIKEEVTAVIVEPIIQGAAGFQIYSPDFLKKLASWARENDIHFIADEIMTGIGRSGKPLALYYAEAQADFICLSKGLTSGFLPLSVVLTSEKIFNVFYADYDTLKGFLHSHTFSGNALAAAVALETLNIMEEEDLYTQTLKLQNTLYSMMEDIALKTQKLTRIRALGGIVAADLVPSDKNRIGYQVFQEAFRLGALIRPIGHTLYWTPPLNIELAVLEELKEITEKAIILAYDS